MIPASRIREIREALDGYAQELSLATQGALVQGKDELARPLGEALLHLANTRTSLADAEDMAPRYPLGGGA